MTFADFTTNNGGFLDGDASDTSTVDGVTLTASTTDGVFQSSGGGTGIEGSGEPNVANDQFQVNTGEDFAFSFDTPGTLTGFTIRVFGDSAAVTVSNGTESETATGFNTTSGLGPAVTLNYSLDFAAGETLSFASVGVGSGGSNGSQGYRIQSVTIDAIPEPASLALLGAGGVLMLGRRRQG